jgi:methylmalonyl-CoA epimerase
VRIDHIGLAVKNLEESIKLYEEVAGLVVTHREEVPTQHVRVAFLAHPGAEAGAGGTEIELLEPTGDEGAIASFLAKRGPGMHHIAFQAESVSAEMSRLKDSGKPPLQDAPRPGARGHHVCFLHPKHCGGTLLELVGEP